MLNIAVTGATSFIGVHLVEELLNRGHQVYAVVRPNSVNLGRLRVHQNLKIIQCDIQEIFKLTKLVDE